MSLADFVVALQQEDGVALADGECTQTARLASLSSNELF